MATAIDLSKSNSGELLRTQLATATRIMNMEEVLEYSGHISVRVPGKDALYIQQRTESRAEVSPESVLMVDFDCNVIEGKGKLVATSDPGAASDFKRGQRVFHQKFGYGHITAVEGNKLSVSFDKAGEKKVIDTFVEGV